MKIILLFFVTAFLAGVFVATFASTAFSAFFATGASFKSSTKLTRASAALSPRRVRVFVMRGVHLYDQLVLVQFRRLACGLLRVFVNLQ